jgi:hypothetical protein
MANNDQELMKYMVQSSFDMGGTHQWYEFPNGYGASVTNAPMLHFYRFHSEIAVMKAGNVCYTSGLTDDVMVVNSEEEEVQVLNQILNLQSPS